MIGKLTVLVVLASAYLRITANPMLRDRNHLKLQRKPSLASTKTLNYLAEDIRCRKKQLIAANLKLTADQAAKTLALYNQYSAALLKDWGSADA